MFCLDPDVLLKAGKHYVLPLFKVVNLGLLFYLLLLQMHLKSLLLISAAVDFLLLPTISFQTD